MDQGKILHRRQKLLSLLCRETIRKHLVINLAFLQELWHTEFFELGEDFVDAALRITLVENAAGFRYLLGGAELLLDELLDALIHVHYGVNFLKIVRLEL